MNTEIIEKIVAIEWKMFSTVNEGEALAACQEDYDTFAGMRKAQFSAWSEDAARSYLDDLTLAEREGRNLAAEKYIHMMKTTEPSKYKALLAKVKLPTEAAALLAKEVSDILLEQTRKLFEEYPYVSGQGRPLYSTLDFGGVISVETYQLGELLTYTEKTLLALKEHIKSLEDKGVSLARTILENSAKHYGYDSLDTAEAATKKWVDEIGIEVSFGCQSCGE